MIKTRRRIFFYPVPGYSQLANWRNGHHAGDEHSITSLLAEHSDSSGMPAPEPGYRLNEYKSANGVTVRYRKSPWEVVKTEEYIANIPQMQEYSEIAICYCEYSPLPEAENPWVEMNRPIVSLDSFEDEKAYETWLSEQPESVREESRAATARLKGKVSERV
jgi:hypothetical protein